MNRKGLPKSRSFPKSRQIYKTLNNLKITIICGFVTILVLRGTIGVGNVDTSTNDLMPDQRATARELSRVLSEFNSESEDEDGPIEVDKDKDKDGANLGNIANPPYSIGPKISDWDEQRRSFFADYPSLVLSSTSGRPRIWLVTGSPPRPCDNPAGDHYLLKSIKNKIDYGRLHGIEIYYNLAHLDREMAGYWSKLPLLRKLMLAHPEVEWFWWMDSDAMFTDMSFELPMSKYEGHSFVVHGWENVVYGNRSWVGLNTGSFLIRNCQWSLDLLDEWSPMGPKGKVREEAGKLLTEALTGRPSFEADDQSALVYLLATQRERWGGKVFLENSYYLHGYWVILVEKYEEIAAKSRPGYGDERWPFVTHFVGCKPCGSYGDYPVEKCLTNMERSFNFGDDQILKRYGFKHRSLGSSKVRKTRNDSSTPLAVADDLIKAVATTTTHLPSS